MGEMVAASATMVVAVAKVGEPENKSVELSDFGREGDQPRSAGRYDSPLPEMSRSTFLVEARKEKMNERTT